jgi:hypothetical protein
MDEQLTRLTFLDLPRHPGPVHLAPAQSEHKLAAGQRNIQMDPAFYVNKDPNPDSQIIQDPDPNPAFAIILKVDLLLLGSLFSPKISVLGSKRETQVLILEHF